MIPPKQKNLDKRFEAIHTCEIQIGNLSIAPCNRCSSHRFHVC